MAPCKPEQVPLKSVEDVQIVVAEPELIRGRHSQEQVRLKAGGQLSVGKRGTYDLYVLRAHRSAHSPLHFLGKAMRNRQHALIQKKTGGAEIAARLTGQGSARLDISIMVKAGVIAVVTDPHVGLVAMQ